MKVLVMGQGYVGLPLAMQAVQAGHEVVGYDPSAGKTIGIQKGESPVEDVSDELLQKALKGKLAGSYWVTYQRSMLSRFDVAVICVPTPLTKGRPDLSYIEDAAGVVGGHLAPGATVILESTTHPGTTRNVLIPLLERRTGARYLAGQDFHVGFSPERIDPGNKEYGFANTTKLISGLTDGCLEKVAGFYRSMGVPLHSMASLENAEMAKILENTFRHVNIALVNELTRIAGGLGVDMWDVVEGAASKPYGFMPFYPGPGVGGHCLPVDPVYLSEHVRTELGTSLGMVELAVDVNREQPAYVVQRLQDGLNRRGVPMTLGTRVLAVGVTYKPDTADRRESPAMAVVELLEARKVSVDVLDPHVTDMGCGGEIPIPVEEYDAVVVLTPHTAIDLTEIADKAVYVLDTRGVMPLGDNTERL